MAIKLGKNAKLYYKVGGLSGGGSFVEATNVKNLTVNASKSTVDATTRGSGGVKEEVVSIAEWPIEFDLLDNGHASVAAFRDNYVNDAAIAVKVLNKAADGEAEGPQYDCAVTKWERGEPIDGAVTYSVAITPTPSDTAPSWLENQ